MAAIPREAVNSVSRILSSVRSSLDAGSQSHQVSFEDLRRAYLRFEEVRFLFRSRIGPLGRRAERVDFAELENEVRLLVSDDGFMSVVGKIRYRPIGPRGDMDVHGFLHPRLIEGDISVADAIVLLVETLEHLPSHFSLNEDAQDADRGSHSIEQAASRLKRIVPKRQNVAPVQFDIIDGRLVVISQPGNATAADQANVAAARSELTSSGRHIVEELERSNCDKRLLDSFKDLQEKIAANADVVRLGLANIACEFMCDKFHCELPDAVSAMMKAHTLGIGMYVAQFPEWQRFAEQAASVELSAVDIPQITAAVDAVVFNLSARPDVADSDVPRTLLALRQLIENPQAASKKAIFAVWRSLENLVIKVYSYGADFLDKTMTKAIDTGSTVAGKAVIVLMTAALAGALAMTPVASHVSQSAWIAKASDVVRSQIEALGR